MFVGKRLVRKRHENLYVGWVKNAFGGMEYVRFEKGFFYGNDEIVECKACFESIRQNVEWPYAIRYIRPTQPLYKTREKRKY